VPIAGYIDDNEDELVKHLLGGNKYTGIETVAEDDQFEPEVLPTKQAVNGYVYWN